MVRGLVLLLLQSSFSSVFAGILAQFRTPLGNIEVELLSEDKPVTVENFLRYVGRGGYTNMFVHRWVPGFVIQGGGYHTAVISTRTVIDSVSREAAIPNEYSVGRTFSNTYGTLAMARVSGLTNSASSEWFFNLRDNRELDTVDGGFTVFGRVVSGTNVLNRFNNLSATNGIYRLQLEAPLNDLPVLSQTPTFNDLVYVDISLLKVHVESVSAGAEISWRSVSNRLNHIEFSEAFPPSWQALVTTNGTGGWHRFVDPAARGRSRFYRVRVDYP
jgi:cyclophilin family peptidyl-prolyl cis-trans isomerase